MTMTALRYATRAAWRAYTARPWAMAADAAIVAVLLCCAVLALI